MTQPLEEMSKVQLVDYCQKLLLKIEDKDSYLRELQDNDRRIRRDRNRLRNALDEMQNSYYQLQEQYGNQRRTPSGELRTVGTW